MATFTLGDTVPPIGLVSSSSNINGDAIGTDITPTGWPSNGKAKAIEVELTVTTDVEADGQVRLAVSKPGDLDPITGLTDPAGGTWSDADGVVEDWGGSATIEAFLLDKFGGWRTDYLDGSPAAIAAIASTSSETPASGGFDVRVKVRSADWSTQDGYLTYHNAGFGNLEFTFYLAGGNFQFRQLNVAETASPTYTVAASSFTLTDDEWVWIRVTYNGSTRKMLQSSDGESWITVDSVSFSGWKGTARTSIDVAYGPGSPGAWDGDLAEFLVYDGAGALIHDLDLSTQTSQNDDNWSSSVSTNVRGDANHRPTSVGETIGSTVRARLDFESAVAMDDWRLIVRCDTGEVSVDEILLEMAGNYGWKVGTL